MSEFITTPKMADSIYPDYPPHLTPEQEQYLLSNIKNWSILNGLAVRPSPGFVSEKTNSPGSLAVTAPVTLFPSLFPRSCFEEARAIQRAYNELYAAIARDEAWLGNVVEEYASPACMLPSLESFVVIFHWIFNSKHCLYRIEFLFCIKLSQD